MNILLLSPYPKDLRPALKQFDDTLIDYTDKIDPKFCKDNQIDFLISYGYRHIIQRSILDMFPLAAINLHISLLPYSRGAHPVFWSVVNRHPLGVTIHLLDQGLDTGNIPFQKEIDTDLSQHTFTTLYDLHRAEIINLFSSKWKYIRRKESQGLQQTGLPTIHRAQELRRWSSCMPDAWDTSISTFNKLASRAEAGEENPV